MKLKPIALLGLITITLTSCGGLKKITKEQALAIAQDISVHDISTEVNEIKKLTYTSESKTTDSVIKLVDRFDFDNNYFYRETVDLPSGIKKEWCYKQAGKFYDVILDKDGQTSEEVTEAFLKARLETIKENLYLDARALNTLVVKYITTEDYDDRVDEYYSDGAGSLKMFQKSEKGKYSFELSIVNYLPSYAHTVYDDDSYTSEIDLTKCELLYPTLK